MAYVYELSMSSHIYDEATRMITVRRAADERFDTLEEAMESAEIGDDQIKRSDWLSMQDDDEEATDWSAHKVWYDNPDASTTWVIARIEY